MKLFDIQMSSNTIESIINFLNSNTVFGTLAMIVSIISFIQMVLERWKERVWRKSFIISVLLFAAIAIFCKMNNLFFEMFIVALFVIGMIFLRRIKKSKQIRANVNDRPDSQITDQMEDSMEGDYLPRVLEFSRSAFKKAEQCLAEDRPKEAIRYLNECREKEKNQVRFTTRYADALIMLNNYSGALVKLNNLSDRQLKKKRKYKSVMIRKAVCYHELHKYLEELDCYDKVIASNYKPEKYYFYRGKVKVRLLEISPYVKAAEKAVLHKYGSRQDFILSAIADFDKALSCGDRYQAKAISYKGSCYFYLSDYEKALDLLYESGNLRDDFANNYVYFGLYHYEKEDIIAAETYLEKGISYNVDNELPYLYLARINYKNGMYDKAISYAARALSILPLINECHGIQGNCYKKKNMCGEAITCYTHAIECEPKDVYYCSRALCYYRKLECEYKKAYDDILKAIELNDTDSYRMDAILYRSRIDQEEGHKIELDVLRNLVQPYAEKLKRYNDAGIIFSHYGYLEEEEKCYRKAIEEKPDNDVPRYNLAGLLKRDGRLEEAVEQLKEAVAFDPMDMKYLTLLEECYRDLDDTHNEIATQVEISNLKKKYLMVNKKNGDAVYQIKKYHEAEKYYQLALHYVANDPATLNNLACTLYCQERYEEAVEALKNAIARASNYYLAYFNLGNCYLRIGNTREDKNLAREKYQKALQISGQFEPARKMQEFMNPSAIKMVIDVEE